MDLTLPFGRTDIETMTRRFPTPFHLYDERHLREKAKDLARVMRDAGVKDFQNYFAVKALPNPAILKLLAEEGMGADCSSMAELAIAEMCELRGEQIMFSSNNTTDEEFAYAHSLDAIINFDDLSLVDRYLDTFGAPTIGCCRFNPGDIEFGGINEAIIGSPKEAKFGMPLTDMFKAYQRLKDAGVSRFGLHTMLLSNDIDWHNHEVIAQMVFEAACQIAQTVGITFEFINLGGGIGVPYRPTEHRFDLESFASAIVRLYRKLELDMIGAPRIVMENGRYVTADSGYLITRAINQKHTHKTYIGVDASMSDLMRPGMYGAYHHITVLGKETQPTTNEVDISGSLCENNDKFAVNRALPAIEMGDILVIHTTGAHGHAMGFQYNGKLRHAEVLFDPGGGEPRLIRRAETLNDYFETLNEKGTYHVPTN